MKRLSLQWRITLMTVLLIGITCVAMNLLLCSSGVYYMDTIVDSLQGSGTVILNEEGTASFDPQLIAPNEELTIVVDGAQGRFRTTNWYITAAVTLLSGILAYFVSGRALKPLRSFASQVEMVQMTNLADMRIDEDVLPEFKQLSRSFNQMLERLNTAFAAQRQFTQQDVLLSCGGLTFDTRSRTATVNGQTLTLTRKETGILEYLMVHQGRPVSQEELMDHVWDNSVDSFSNSIRVHISALRKKLRAVLGYDPIRNRIGEGYLMGGEEA